MRRLAILPLLFFPLSLTAPARAVSAPPRNVLLARGRTEPVVAIDPRDPSTVVVGSNTNYDAPVGGTFPPAYFTSHDGGRSFGGGNVPILPPYTTGADPSVTIAQNGTVFFTYLGETPSYCSSGRSAVLITHSTDGGRSFRVPTLVDSNSADDKPFSALENTSGRYAHLFVTWTRWHGQGSDIWYARSTDGGATFSPPVMLYSSTLDNFGSVPIVGPGGHIYVFWSQYVEGALTATSRAQILMRASVDDGAHFGPVRGVDPSFWSVPRMSQPDSLRNLPFPAAAVAGNGTLYVSWAAATRQRGQGVVDADIELSRSLNGGATWSAPVHVNTARRSDRFMPSISVLPDQSVGISFYDRRRGSSQLDVYAADVSYAGGVHVSRNVRVDRGSSPTSDIYYIAPGSTCFSPGRFFGDYIGTSAGKGRALCVVWADTQLHVSGETDLWFARVKLPRP